MRSLIGMALAGIVVWGIRRIARRLTGDVGLAESLRDHARREMAQGWEGPRWRLPAEIDEMAKRCRC